MKTKYKILIILIWVLIIGAILLKDKKQHATTPTDCFPLEQR